MSNVEFREHGSAAPTDRESRPTWFASYSDARVGGLPAWLFLALTVMSVYLAMPQVHRWTYGADRIREATVEETELALGRRLTSDAREFLIGQSEEHPPVLRGTFQVFVVGIGIILTSVFLTTGSILSGALLPAARSVAIATLSASVTLVTRLAYWVAFLVWLGLDRSAEVDWLRSTRVSAEAFLPQLDTLTLASTLHALDLTVMLGAAVSFLGLRALAPDMSRRTAGVAASGYLVVSVCARVALSWYAGFPV